MMAIIMAGFPSLHEIARDLGTQFADLGIGMHSFGMGIVAGALVTLMTWMQHGTESMPAKIFAAVTIGFLVAAGEMNHVIVASLEMVAALVTGAPFSYWDLSTFVAWAALANAVGGIGLVTLLRLAQVEGIREVS